MRLQLLSVLIVAASALAGPVKRGVGRIRPNTAVLDPDYMVRAAANPDAAELGNLVSLADRLLGVGPWTVTSKTRDVPGGTR